MKFFDKKVCDLGVTRNSQFHSSRYNFRLPPTRLTRFIFFITHLLFRMHMGIVDTLLIKLVLLISIINLFQAHVLFLHPMKTSETHQVF